MKQNSAQKAETRKQLLAVIIDVKGENNMEFKIPNKFILGGIEHSVEMVQKLDDNALGWFDPTVAVISLAQTKRGMELSASMKRQCFWHEMIHAILNVMGKDKLYNDESFVNTFASFLSGAIDTMEE